MGLISRVSSRTYRKHIAMPEKREHDNEPLDIHIPNKQIRKQKLEEKYNKPRKLSKKERRKYEKILEKKQAKTERPDLYEELKKYQVNSSVLSQMSSVATMHIKTKASESMSDSD